MLPAVPAQQQPAKYGRFHPTELEVDGRKIKFRIKKLSLGERAAFVREFNQCGLIGKRAEALVERHRQSDDELPDNVLARLELDQTTEDRDARWKRNKEDDAFALDFVTRAITDYVSAEPGQLYWEDDPTTSLTTGAQLLELFGARQDVIQDLIASIYLENVLDEVAKKKLKELSASARGSTTSTPTAPGGAPAPTAAPVSVSPSAPSADATAPSLEMVPAASGATTS